MEYPYEKILQISERISTMRHKKFRQNLKDIKEIIENNNVNVGFTKNNNGYFATNFETCSLQTFHELEKYFTKIDCENAVLSTSDTKPENKHTTIPLEKKEIERGKFKYTNSENHILNKMKYEKALKKHQSDYEEEKNSNIFKKK